MKTLLAGALIALVVTSPIWGIALVLFDFEKPRELPHGSRHPYHKKRR